VKMEVKRLIEEEVERLKKLQVE